MIGFTLVLLACFASSAAFAADCPGNTVEVSIVDTNGVESEACMAPIAALRVAECPCGAPAIEKIHHRDGSVTKVLICEDESSVTPGSLLRLGLGVYRPPRRCAEPVHSHLEPPLAIPGPLPPGHTIDNDRGDYAETERRFSVWEGSQAEKRARDAQVERAQRDLRDETAQVKAERDKAQAELEEHKKALKELSDKLEEIRAEGGE